MMPINGELYWQQLMQLAEITDPDKPYTRRSFTSRFLQGRAWLTQQFEAAGLETHIDAAGNLIGRLKGNGSRQGVLMVGSHSDTVPSGGRFDGIAGVIAALACVQAWQARGVTLNHDVEIVDFLAEEPSEWGLSCIGSRGMSGALTETHLATPHPATGELLSVAIQRVGGQPDALVVRDDIAAMFELHIEQGRVLEHEAIDIGVVSAIVGITRLAITLNGQANHAGTTPMYLRQDANVAAAEVILAAERLAQDMAESLTQTHAGYFVATCGQIFSHPNASNVVAGQCRLVFDIRSDVRQAQLDFVAQLREQVDAIAKQRAITVSEWALLSDTDPSHSDEQLMQAVRQAADDLSISHRTMPSGAGHDAAFLSRLAPMVMVFVPSQNGISHNPAEWTDQAALTRGVSVLCNAIELFDKNS